MTDREERRAAAIDYDQLGAVLAHAMGWTGYDGASARRAVKAVLDASGLLDQNEQLRAVADHQAAWAVEAMQRGLIPGVTPSRLLEDDKTLRELEQLREFRIVANQTLAAWRAEVERLRGLLEDEYEQVGCPARVPTADAIDHRDREHPNGCATCGGTGIVFRKVLNTGEPK